ncbi:MAG: restriction endonuclease subunit S [Peptococcaceae bacterium]|nr:restriction endonuclease subunit S [Peptococcaceae bacterium]
MSKWEKAKLGTLGDFKSGGTPTRSRPEYFKGEIPWITTVSLGKTLIDDSDAVEHITAEAVEKSATKIIRKNSLMVGIRVGVGKVSVNTVPMCTNQDIISIENIDESWVFKPYLVRCINNFSRYFAEQKRGATIQGVNSAVLKSLDIPLPPLETQKQIAKTLDTAAELLAMRKQQLVELDNLIKSTFYDMFGDPVTNEKGWEIKQIGDISLIQGGLQVTSKRAENPLELPYLRVANVYRDFLDLREIKTIKVTDTEAKRISLNKGDILIVEGHGNPTEIGRSAVWDGSIQPCVHQNHLIRVRLNINFALPNFISYYINSASGRQQMFKACKTTSGLNTISTKNVKETQVFLPPLYLQNKFTEIVTKIEEQKAILKRAAEETRHLFNSLMSKYFD